MAIPSRVAVLTLNYTYRRGLRLDVSIALIEGFRFIPSLVNRTTHHSPQFIYKTVNNFTFDMYQYF